MMEGDGKGWKEVKRSEAAGPTDEGKWGRGLRWVGPGSARAACRGSPLVVSSSRTELLNYTIVTEQ